MKKVLSILLVISLFFSLSSISVTAANNVKEPQLDFSGKTEYVEICDEACYVHTFTNNNYRIAEITRADGRRDTIVFDDLTGHVYVNGRNIVISTSENSSNAVLNSASNWGPVQEVYYLLDVAGLSVQLIAILILGYVQMSTGISVATQAAALIVNTGLSKVYYYSCSQYNYVDYLPKVGYRLTEQIHSDTRFNSDSLIFTIRDVEGSR